MTMGYGHYALRDSLHWAYQSLSYNVGTEARCPFPCAEHQACFLSALIHGSVFYQADPSYPPRIVAGCCTEGHLDVNWSCNKLLQTGSSIPKCGGFRVNFAVHQFWEPEEKTRIGCSMMLLWYLMVMRYCQQKRSK